MLEIILICCIAFLIIVNILLVYKLRITVKTQSDKFSERLIQFERNVYDELKYLAEADEKRARLDREEFSRNMGNFRKEQSESIEKISESVSKSLEIFQNHYIRNMNEFTRLQKEKFGELSIRQKELIDSTEKKLEEMRLTVDEKLQKTLHERIGQSFEIVSKQLESVQKGLGEMQNLAQDVGGLKKVLSNVKIRGTIGEIQLEMLLEQLLAPDQYEKNVKTKKNSDKLVEFAIKLPGQDDMNTVIYLPIDAKFPKDTYEQFIEAHESSDTNAIDMASKNIENTIRKMAKDIKEKYLSPPDTTDFGIMFLPFESIYGEVTRRTHLLEQLQNEYHVIVTGPTTLAAILNSLQMGFRTLAIQKRSSQVWRILATVKNEFNKFGGMLEKAQKNLQTANNQLEEVMGKRTRAIQRQLRNVEIHNNTDNDFILEDFSDTPLELEDDNQDI